MSCLTPVGMVEGRAVRTVDSSAIDGAPSPPNRRWKTTTPLQCGMCFPGMLMTLTRFLEDARDPTREDVKAALVGNLCRCTGYERIIDAALAAAAVG